MTRVQVRPATFLTMAQCHVEAGIVTFLTCLQAFFHFTAEWVVHAILRHDSCKPWGLPMLPCRLNQGESYQLPPNFICRRMKTM